MTNSSSAGFALFAVAAAAAVAIGVMLALVLRSGDGDENTGVEREPRAIVASQSSPLPVAAADDGIERRPLTIVAAGGATAEIQVEIADTRDERGVGLSGRTELPADAGMLFVFQESSAGFWMKDTHVPLSVAFIAPCGEIVAIQDMEPLSLDIHNTEIPYGFGLETPQGWFDANGIATGDVVSIPEEYLAATC